VIEVNVQSRKNRLVRIVLQIEQLLIEHADVVIVDQRDRPDDLAVGILPGSLHQFVPDQIPKGLRTVLVAPLMDQGIEFFEQVGVKGHANPRQVAHDSKITAAREAVQGRGSFVGETSSERTAGPVAEMFSRLTAP
jgi:hypothetical protein